MALSISKLAKESGYTITHVRRVLSRKNQPSWECARKLARIAGMSLDEFAAYLDNGKAVPVNLLSLEEE